MRYLLFPFSFLYLIITSVRNKLYDYGILSSVKFDFPVISIGNLSTGGTGKTPHIEYLIRLLAGKYKTAILSRGYGRVSKGLLEVTKDSVSIDVGDEPLQIKKKFPEVKVFVSERRQYGINKMKSIYPDIDLILLDDAFQHRSVTPKLSILLTEYNNPFYKDYILPIGNLRESRSGARRADIIIVSKCPLDISNDEKDEIITSIKLNSKQKVFFSHLKYSGEAYNIFNIEDKIVLDKNTDVLLVAAIAKPIYLLQHIEYTCHLAGKLIYKDHHSFSMYDMNKINKHFKKIKSTNKYILTTEKDATRLEIFQQYFKKNELKVYCLPVSVKLNKEDEPLFNEIIEDNTKERF